MRFVAIIGVFMLLGCGSKQTVTHSPPTPAPPAWVENRPNSATYYIGIGVAPKRASADYRKMAKDNAISDLAGEIQVRVNTQSLLHTLESDARFRQEFQESIRTQSDLSLSDHEMVDTWEDENYHWVYYRLEKARWAEIQAELRSAAQKLALDFLSKAEAEAHLRNFSASADYYLRGLQAIKEFRNEANEVDYRGKPILLGNALLTGLTDLIGQTTPVIENSPTLDFADGYKTRAEIRVTRNGSPMENVPLKSTYSGTYGTVRGGHLTNADGRVEVEISDADRSGKANVFVVEVDVETLMEPFRNDKFMRIITASLSGNSARKNIDYHPPEVFIKDNERNMGKKLSLGPIATAVKNSLNRKGIVQTNEIEAADLIVEITADTKKDGTSQGFKVAVLNVTVTVREGGSGRELFGTSNSDIKGLSLSYPEAGMAAFDNFTKNIESHIMRQLSRSLF